MNITFANNPATDEKIKHIKDRTNKLNLQIKSMDQEQLGQEKSYHTIKKPAKKREQSTLKLRADFSYLTKQCKDFYHNNETLNEMIDARNSIHENFQDMLEANCLLEPNGSFAKLCSEAALAEKNAITNVVTALLEKTKQPEKEIKDTVKNFKEYQNNLDKRKKQIKKLKNEDPASKQAFLNCLQEAKALANCPISCFTNKLPHIAANKTEEEIKITIGHIIRSIASPYNIERTLKNASKTLHEQKKDIQNAISIDKDQLTKFWSKENAEHFHKKDGATAIDYAVCKAKAIIDNGIEALNKIEDDLRNLHINNLHHLPLIIPSDKLKKAYELLGTNEFISAWHIVFSYVRILSLPWRNYMGENLTKQKIGAIMEYVAIPGRPLFGIENMIKNAKSSLNKDQRKTIHQGNYLIEFYPQEDATAISDVTQEINNTLDKAIQLLNNIEAELSKLPRQSMSQKIPFKKIKEVYELIERHKFDSAWRLVFPYVSYVRKKTSAGQV